MAGNSKPSFAELGKAIEEAKALESKAKKMREEVKKSLYKYINSHWGEDSSRFFPTEEGFVIGRERRVSTTLNKEKLFDIIDAEAYNFITYTVTEVDEDKLKVALKDGLVSPTDLESCIDERVAMALVHRKNKETDSL